MTASSLHGFMKANPCFNNFTALYNEVTSYVDKGRAEDIVSTSKSPKPLTLFPITSS